MKEQQCPSREGDDDDVYNNGRIHEAITGFFKTPVKTLEDV